MADLSFSNFEVNSAGIAEICKSGDMQSILQGLADGLCSSANEQASNHTEELHIDEFTVPPYAADVDVLDFTALGAVHTNSEMGRIDHAKFQTLNAINH